jgi:hypothetical protein
MKRTLLIGLLLTFAVVGGAVKELPRDRTTILKAKVQRLPVPTQGYQAYTPRDVILIGGNTQILAQPPSMAPSTLPRHWVDAHRRIAALQKRFSASPP